jgi:Cdc6-like AAA superfamily ATPase
MHKEIKDFFQVEDTAPLNIIISGENGSGKTHAARALIEKLQKDQSLTFANQISMINTKIN